MAAGIQPLGQPWLVDRSDSTALRRSPNYQRTVVIKYPKWVTIVIATITGFAIYGEISSGSTLQFAMLEAHPLFVGVTAMLVVLYVVIAGVRKFSQGRSASR